MKKILFLLFFILVSSIGIVLIPFSKAQNTNCDINNVQNVCGGTNGFSSSCSDLLNQCESSINQALQASINATAPLQSKLDGINSQIKGIKNTVADIEENLAGKKRDIEKGYLDLAKQQNILNITIRDYYIKSYYNSPLLLLLSANSVSEFTQILGYQRANADRDKAIITNIAVTIKDLEDRKKQLEAQETQLTALKAALDKQSAELDKIVSGAKAYQSTLSTQLSQLNSIQQSILAAKLAGLNIPLYAYTTQGGCSSDIDPYKDPGFGGTKFGFFTYGVPNRVGMNQYGAKGRAEANSSISYSDILHAYYNNVDISDTDTSKNIVVNGTNEYGQTFNNQSMNIEDYVKHIYEMPTNWPAAALQAQAVAARTYGLYAMSKGFVYPSQKDQVVKQEINSQAWQDAVDATKGKIMTNGGQPIAAWFSSTHGGIEYTSGEIGWQDRPWTKHIADTPSGSVSSFDDLKSNAYDKNSPWFYCDWGGRSAYNKTAWLKGDEVADIVNVILLLQNNSDARNHLYQTDKPNPAGTDTWDASRVKQELSKYRTPYNSISNISVSADFNSGRATTVNVTGDAGSVGISASDFKNYFNLRAPANIQIVGPLYNVEQR